MIEGHGNDIYKYKGKIIADFSSNIVYYGISSKLEKHLAQNTGIIVNYPEPDAISLQKEIAQHHKLDQNNVLVTNGSTEAFYLIAQLFHGKKSLINIPSFSEYEDACRSHKHIIEFLPNESILSKNKISGDTIWIGNPNNPDGKTITLEQIQNLIKYNPDTYFIIDEAYAELSINHESCITLIDKYSNLIILRSLTKSFAIPGIRLGYIVADETILKKLLYIKAPWSVNSLAIEAGKYILQNYNNLLPDIHDLVQRSKKLQHELQKIPGIEIFESNCNYFLVKLKKGSSAELKNFLINNCGILIRDASNFKGLDNTYFRLSVQNERNNNNLIKGIKDWFLLIYI